MLSFGVTILPDPPWQRLVELMQLAEQNGFDYGWTYDSHVLWQEPYPLLTLAAMNTERLHLGLNVTNPGTREPTVTASAFATLQDVSNGRMIMGIGRGDSARRTIGQQPVKVAEFEAACRMIRDLMNGRPVEWNDTEIELDVGEGPARDPAVHRRLRAARARGRRPRRRRRDHPARRPGDRRVDRRAGARGPPRRRAATRPR